MKPHGISAGRAGFYAAVCAVVGAGVGFILYRAGVPVAGTMLIAAAAAVALALILWAIVMVTGRS
jgi:hypothetical protein